MLTGSSRVTLSQSPPSRIQWGVTSSPWAFPGMKTENNVRIAVRSRMPPGKEGPEIWTPFVVLPGFPQREQQPGRWQKRN